MIKVNGKLVSEFDPSHTVVFHVNEFLDNGEITGEIWTTTSDGSYLDSVAQVLPITLIRWTKYNWVRHEGVTSIAVHGGKVFGIKG